MSNQAKKLEPADEFRNWMFDQGAASLWEHRVNDSCSTEAFGLRGRVVIVQTFHHGGYEVYVPVEDRTIEGTKRKLLDYPKK